VLEAFFHSVEKVPAVPTARDGDFVSHAAKEEIAMKTYNRVLFHCERCGRVVRAEPSERDPYCCGRSMTNAAVETVFANEHDRVQESAGQAGADPPRHLSRPVPR
jgi:hypothetical protein